MRIKLTGFIKTKYVPFRYNVLKYFLSTVRERYLKIYLKGVKFISMKINFTIYR